MADRVVVRYVGPSSLVDVLVADLRRRHLTVEATSPDDERMVDDVLAGFVVTGAAETLRSVVGDFLDRAGRGVVTVDGLRFEVWAAELDPDQPA